MLQSEIKTSGFDTKVETFPATDPPLPRTNSFIQSRGWTGCIYHLAQSWVCCCLFGYWESKPTGSSFIAALQGDSVWQYCWPGKAALCALCEAPWGLHRLRHNAGSVCNRRMEAVLPKGVPKSLCASQSSLSACSEHSKWGKGWWIISFPSQTSYYCFGQFIPLRMHKANKPCSPQCVKACLLH